MSYLIKVSPIKSSSNDDKDKVQSKQEANHQQNCKVLAKVSRKNLIKIDWIWRHKKITGEWCEMTTLAVNKFRCGFFSDLLGSNDSSNIIEINRWAVSKTDIKVKETKNNEWAVLWMWASKSEKQRKSDKLKNGHQIRRNKEQQMSLKVDIKVEEIKNSGWTVLKMDIKVRETKKIRWA